MAEVNPPVYMQAGSHSAEGHRRLNELIFGAQPGVWDVNALKVEAQSSPNMTIKVNTGLALVKGNEDTFQGLYMVDNQLSKNVTISAAHASLARRDLIVARVYDSEYLTAVTNVWALEVVTGTAAASPADPTVPKNCLVLARIALPAAASTVTNAYISDFRSNYSANGQAGYMAGAGGVIVCTSGSRPVAPRVGQRIYETDTDREHIWNGTGYDCTSGSYSGTGAISYSATTEGTATQSATVTVLRGTWLVTASFNSEHSLSGNEWIAAYIESGGTVRSQARTTILAGTTYEAAATLTALVTVTAATQTINLKHYRQTTSGSVIAANCIITAIAV